MIVTSIYLEKACDMVKWELQFDCKNKVGIDWKNKILKWKFYKHKYNEIKITGCKKLFI